MFTRSALKTLVLNTIYTVCITQTVYCIGSLCVKYGMHAYAGQACICRMHAPSMLIPPTQVCIPPTQVGTIDSTNKVSYINTWLIIGPNTGNIPTQVRTRVEPSPGDGGK